MSFLVFYHFDCLSVVILSIQANIYDFTPAAVLNLIKIPMFIYFGKRRDLFLKIWRLWSPSTTALGESYIPLVVVRS